MNQWKRRTVKWTLRGLVVLVAVVALYVALLAFPHPLFAHGASFDEFSVRSNKPIPPDFDQVIEDARSRIEAMEFGRPGANTRVFICGDAKLYAFFTRLVRRSPDSMAIGLSVFGNLYLNETKIRRVAANNPGGIRYCRFEGNYGEVIAHEIAHFTVVEALGYRAAIRMPFWKSEGYAEHQANLAAVRADSSYDFLARVDLLRDEAFWGGFTVARRLFEWHVLVEFLIEIEGMGLHELVAAEVTEAAARDSLSRWYRNQRSTG